MANKQLYWKGEDELLRTKEFLATQKNEFNEALPLDEVFSENSSLGLNSNRRDFLKFFGFSVAAVTLAACNKTPVRNVVPYLVKPEEITPGVANYYNTTLGIGSSAIGLNVKTREGRPIKIDGNFNSPVSNGSANALAQASVLSLYDNERLTGAAKISEKEATITEWGTLDAEITKKLNDIQAAGGKIALVTNTINSPSSTAVINDFKLKFTNTTHFAYDSVSYSGILLANKDSFGKQVIPSYNFGKAMVIVSFGADYLGTWLSANEYNSGWAKNRKPENGKMSRTIQFESNLSLSGSNADYRFPMRQSEEAIYITSLYNEIAKLAGGSPIQITKSGELAGNAIKQAADALWKEKGSSLVISGSNDVNIQKVVNGINLLLNNYGSTIDLDNYSNQWKGIDAEFAQFAKDFSAGAYAGVIFWNTNPVYNYPASELFVKGLKQAKLSVAFTTTKDETSELCQYIATDNHYLESWGDAEPKAGAYHFMQPTITPVFNTRQAQMSLLTWAGIVIDKTKDTLKNKAILNQNKEAAPFYLYMRNLWATMGLADDASFNKALHDGVYILPAKPQTVPSFAVALNSLVPDLEKTIGKKDAIDLVLYQNIAILDGALSNNPWLQEMPDPMSKVTWDNYISLPKALAESKEIQNGDTVNITVNGKTLTELPVFIQPGQTNNTIGLAIGYGRTGKVGEKGKFESIGQNAFPLIGAQNGTQSYVINGVKLEKAEAKYELAQTQTHHHIEGRDLVRETNLEAYKKSPNAGNDKPQAHLYTLWETKDYKKDGAPNHHWAMAIDLNACTGCGSCLISCSIENNVPVVGRAEVRKRREMHWIRVDRYFSFKDSKHLVDKEDSQYEGEFITKEKGLEKADEKAKGSQFEHWENVKVMHQPMMCQHCGNAPCETVCPVLATTHSTEGLNQMTYNRCIGTKYCANNCPYKVRRFNWFRYNDNNAFDFHFNNDLGKMVINPDVTVRTRGVMEKCSMCVQSIQAAKVKAKRERRTLKDGDAKTACQRSCPSGAIVFGDVNDENSEIRKLFKNERSFRVLEELNVQSSVKYLTKVRNIDSVKA